MGLSVMLFADKEKYFMPSAFFEGFKVLVHHPEDFPSVKEDGFVVAPGTENFVAVDAFGIFVKSMPISIPKIPKLLISFF